MLRKVRRRLAGSIAHAPMCGREPRQMRHARIMASNSARVVTAVRSRTPNTASPSRMPCPRGASTSAAFTCAPGGQTSDPQTEVTVNGAKRRSKHAEECGNRCAFAWRHGMCWRCIRRKHAEMPGATFRMHALSPPIAHVRAYASTRVFLHLGGALVVQTCSLRACRIDTTTLPMRLHASRAGVALLAGASFVASSSGECCMSRLHDRKRVDDISRIASPLASCESAKRDVNQPLHLHTQPFRRARRASRVARLRSLNADTRPPSRALRRACR